MQTGLFDPDLNTKINRTMAQIQKRGFELKECYKDLAGLGSYFSDNKALVRYKDKLYRLLGEGRHYEQIGEAACDNLYDLEALAVAAYGPRFTRNLALIADFSDCLDLVMHRTYGCRIKDIRKIDNYSVVSWSMLNKDFTHIGTEVTFESLLSASNEFYQHMSGLSAKVKESPEIPAEEQVGYMVYLFYKELLAVLHRLKFYAMADVCRQLSGMGNKTVIRSMSYSSVLACTSEEFNDAVILHQLDGTYEDYSVPFRTYKPYEYAGEVLRKDELAWGI